VSNPSALQLFWWVGLPYLALGIFVVGHIWRWRYDQFGWTSRSTQLQERRLLKWGSPVFHYGTFAAIAGHVIGVLIPESWTRAIGIPENAYRWFSAAAGTLAAVLVIAGVVILAGRRLLVPRVRATTSPVDYVALILLLIVILTGIAPTIGVNLFGHGYDYRTTVAPWFRGRCGHLAGWSTPGATRCGTCGGPTSSTAAAAPPRRPSPAPAAAGGGRSACPTDADRAPSPAPRTVLGRPAGFSGWRRVC